MTRRYRKHRQPAVTATEVACPFCGAPVGDSCSVMKLDPVCSIAAGPHRARVRALVAGVVTTVVTARRHQ